MFASDTPDEGVLNLALAARGTDYRIAIMAPTEAISTLEGVLSPPEVTFLDTGHKSTQDRLIAWLRSLESRPLVSEMRSRGAIEALHKKVNLLVTENDDLVQLLNDYADQVEQAKGDLTEAQIEVRGLKAALDQVRDLNAALIRELSKPEVDKESASLIVRAIRKTADYVMVGAITFGATYAGTVAAQPPETEAKVSTARLAVVVECDQAIETIDGPLPPSSEDVHGVLGTD